MLSKLTQTLFFILFSAVSIFTKAQGKLNSQSEKSKITIEKQSIQANSSINSVKFRNIGPSIMSGRVVDVDANPSDPTEFYVAYASGGVCHSKHSAGAAGAQTSRDSVESG